MICWQRTKGAGAGSAAVSGDAKGKAGGLRRAYAATLARSPCHTAKGNICSEKEAIIRHRCQPESGRVCPGIRECAAQPQRGERL
jgi:hypothetical protein